MIEPIYDYDPAAVLDNEESIAVFLTDAMETGDAAYIAKAMGVVARAKGIKEIAQKTGLSHENINQLFSEQGNPSSLSPLTHILLYGNII